LLRLHAEAPRPRGAARDAAPSCPAPPRGRGAAAAAPPGDILRIGAVELRTFISDAGELQKGTLIFDSGGLSNLARYQSKLFCDAKGSSPAPYKVTITFNGAPAPEFKARCSCPAAFKRPFCKHAAALLVAWARAPESFVVSDA